MKVNIAGKGIIPYINRIAPAMNVEVSEVILKKLVKNPKFKIYNSNGFGQITAATFEPIPETAPVVEAPKPKKEKKAVKKAEEVPGVVKEIVVEEKAPVVEETPIEEPVVEEAPVAEEIEQVEEPVELNEEVDAEAIEEPVEEVSEGEEAAAPVQTSNKKKKRNRK